MDLVQRTFGRGNGAVHGFDPAPALPAGDRIMTGRRDTTQAQLCVGVPALPRDHPLTKRLLPQYLSDIADCEAKKAELDATIKAAQPTEDEEEAEEPEEKLSDDEVKALKKELGAAKKKLKTLQADFVKQLDAAIHQLDQAGARELVLGILRGQLDAILVRYVATHRQGVVAAFESWWDKYRVMLVSIEAERDAAATRLRSFLGALGYAE